MADQYNDNDENLELDGPDLLKDLRRQIKALSKDKADLAQELSGLRAASRERSVTDVLTAKGFNPKVAKFIPSDVEGDDAISKWLDENADVFGFKKSDEGETPTKPNVSDADVSEAKRLQALGQTAIAPSKFQDLEARLANAQTDAEIQEIWAEMQRGIL